MMFQENCLDKKHWLVTRWVNKATTSFNHHVNNQCFFDVGCLTWCGFCFLSPFRWCFLPVFYTPKFMVSEWNLETLSEPRSVSLTVFLLCFYVPLQQANLHIFVSRTSLVFFISTASVEKKLLSKTLLFQRLLLVSVFVVQRLLLLPLFLSDSINQQSVQASQTPFSSCHLRYVSKKGP
jgi:hypothetical protein